MWTKGKINNNSFIFSSEFDFQKLQHLVIILNGKREILDTARIPSKLQFVTILQDNTFRFSLKNKTIIYKLKKAKGSIVISKLFQINRNFNNVISDIIYKKENFVLTTYGVIIQGSFNVLPRIQTGNIRMIAENSINTSNSKK